MKQLLLILIFGLLTFVSMAQTPPVRLHVQASKAELAGDGDDYTTIVVTARDPDGEIITTMNGKVGLLCSSGFLDETELQMTNGIAFTRYTAPIFGQPIKAAQRMVYFTVKFMRRFLSRSGGSTDQAANQKLAQKIAIETFREINPLTLMPKKNGDNNVYFVAEMNGIKGKTKVLIQKATEGGNSALVPGYYSGYDITGQAPFELMLESGGKGQMTQGGTEAYSVLFTSEKSAEINSLMKKMMGGGEWMNAYMGASERDQQYMEGYDIKKNGLPSIYLPMPNNGIFLYVPPILLEYQGRPKETISVGTAGITEEVEKKPRVFVTIEQNELIGDGRTVTKAIFHYEDENKVPVAGKSFTWSIPKEIKVISSQTVTDASGNAVAVIQMPLLKAKEEKRGDMWGQIIDNTALYRITTHFSTPKSPNESAYIDFSVYKTIEKNLRILKPGFETKAVKVLLPQLDEYRLESSVYALIEMMNSPSIPDKAAVSDAIVFFERKKFDEEYFNRNYEYYFKKDRKMFMTMLDDAKGGFMALTDANGNFKLDVGGKSSRIIKAEPLQAKLSDLTGKRKGSLAIALKNFKDVDFTLRMIDALFNMDKELCSSQHQQAVCLEEKLHILGNLMTNLNNASGMVNETTGEMYDACWEAVGVVASFVNDEYKITEGLSKATGLEKLQEKAGTYGAEKIKGYLEKYGGTKITGTLKSKIYQQLYKRIFALSDKGKIKGVEFYYKSMGESVSNGISELLSDYIEALSDWADKWISKNIADPKGYFVSRVQDVYYSKIQQDITRYMAASPEKVHVVYDRLQPMLIDRSAELGKLYADVGKFRMDMGYYKADKDLFADLSKGAVIIGTVLVTRDYARMVDLIEKIEKGSKAIDGLMAANNLYQEYGNYCAMLFNVKGCFTLASNSISAGTIVTEKLNEPEVNFSIFPSALASLPPAVDTKPLALKAIHERSLASVGSELPVDQLPLLIENADKIDAWIAENESVMFSIAEKSPKAVSAFFTNAVEYENHLVNLISIAVTDAGSKNPLLIAKWNEESGKLSSNMQVIASEGIKISATATSLPKTTSITLEENSQSETGKFFFENRKLLIIIGVTSIVVILAVFFIRFVRRRKKVQQMQSTAQTVITTERPPSICPPLSQPTINQPISQTDSRSKVSAASYPKFCPQCGAVFTPGKKFCGKCGYKP